MLSINNNNCNYIERERQVIELYDQGKSTLENMHRRNVDTLQNDIDRLFNERRPYDLKTVWPMTDTVLV